MMERANLTIYTYTGYGALASEALGKGTTAYSYNGQDQLTGVTAPDGTRSTYTFDGDGMRRAAQEGNVQPTTFVWDGSDYLLLNEPTGNRVVLTLESEVVACGTKDLLTDPLGSLVREIASGASLGSLVEMYPYETLVKDTGAATTPFVFVAAYGYYTDSSSRDYVRARELMKSIGRWMQVDPLWPEESLYSCAHLRPTIEVDRFGNGFEDCPKNHPARQAWRDLKKKVRARCPGLQAGIAQCFRECGEGDPDGKAECFCNHGTGGSNVRIVCRGAAWCNSLGRKIRCMGTYSSSWRSACTINICMETCPAGLPWEDALLHELMHCCGVKHWRTKRRPKGECDPDCLERCLRGLLGFGAKKPGPDWTDVLEDL